MSLIRHAVVLMVFALSACAKAEKPPEAVWPPKPTREFLALSARDQNLAVYDAFVSAIESNYYDSKYLASDEWRGMKTTWREKAANVGQMPFALHNEVLREMLKHLPESHFSVEYPKNPGESSTPEPSERAKETVERYKRLYPLYAVGPGLECVKVRRGTQEFFLVGDVWPDTLAEENGIRPGWRTIVCQQTLSIEDNAVHFVGEFVPLDAEAAHAWERGQGDETAPPPGSLVHVRFDHRMIKYRQLFETRRLDGGVRYVRFNGFGDAEFLKPVFEAIDSAGPDGLIVDLRWNGGGLADQMKRIAAALMGAGVLVGSIVERSGQSEMRSSTYTKRYTGPLVVLVGPLSGSASEILAAAVQDQKRGRLVGRMTNGSVLQSQQFALPDSGYVQVPISNYFRNDGRRIEGVGVEPDVWILPTLDDVRAKRDPVLDRALQELKKWGHS